MTKRVIVLLLCVCARLGCSAQQYFNVRNTLYSFAEQLTSVVQSNGRYYVTGYGIDSINQLPNNVVRTILGVKFAVFDTFGNLIRDTVYQLLGKGITAGYNNLRRMPDGTFLLAVDDQDSLDNYRLLLLRFDSLGHVVWNKEFNRTVCTAVPQNLNFWRMVDFKPTANDQWLMFSTIGCGNAAANYNADFLLTKLDSNFNIIWNKQYGSPDSNDIAGRLLGEPDGYLMAGGYNNDNFTTGHNVYYAEMFKVDTGGNILWSWLRRQQDQTFRIRDVLRTKDGSIVYCGQGAGYQRPGNINTDVIFKSWVEKLDANRNHLWSDTLSFSIYNSSTDDNELTNLKEMPNGDIMVAGQITSGFNRGDTGYINFGALARLSANGGVIWERKYTHPNDTLIYHFYDLKQTDDGGFIMAGQATDEYYPYTYPVQQGWLVKVDSNGCNGPNDPQCWRLDVPVMPRLAGVARVYPNPVTNTLSVDYSNKGNDGAIIEISNMLGQVMARQLLPGKAGTAEINMRSLAAGVYSYRIIEGGQLIMQGKLMKI